MTDPTTAGLRVVAGYVQVSAQLINRAIEQDRAIREWKPPAMPLVWEGDQA